MNRLTCITAAAILACCGITHAQEKPAAAQPDMKADKPKADIKKLAIGDPAPALSVEKWVKGDPITGFEKGKVYIVEYWATWCGPCIASMPHLSEIQKANKSKGLTVIGMASADSRDELAKVEEMVKAKGETMAYTVAWDKEGATHTAYMKASRQRGIPTSFVVDQKGEIAWIGHPMQLDFVIDDVLAGKWDAKEGPAKIEKMQEEAQALMEDAESNPKATLKAINEFQAKYPKMAAQMMQAKYSVQLDAEMYPEAYATAGVLIDEAIAKKDFMALNEIAWGIVDPEGAIKTKDKNVDVAMKAALKAVEFTNEKDGAILDTLACCYWLKGDKAKAIEFQKKAIANLTKAQVDMKEQLEATLKTYEGGKN